MRIRIQDFTDSQPFQRARTITSYNNIGLGCQTIKHSKAFRVAKIKCK
ncbi:hypothetical protein CHEID_08600 [Corynebacterium heidelbergense]|nr:hypothetical protein CHEID_08600 [Corynebacterium heidelbergense]